jgi:hypothetical protein
VANNEADDDRYSDRSEVKNERSRSSSFNKKYNVSDMPSDVTPRS